MKESTEYSIQKQSIDKESTVLINVGVELSS